MTNPWLSVPLEAYEAHMSSPQVGQAILLADVLDDALRIHEPEAVAVIGCAGGNGFERIMAHSIHRLVGIDINAEFLKSAAARFQGRIPQLELVCADVQSDAGGFRPVDLAYAGMVFEYLVIEKALPNIRTMLSYGGILVTVSQLPSSIADVTPSQHSSRLDALSLIFEHVDPDCLREQAEQCALELMSSRVASIPQGKQFQVLEFRAI